MRRRHRVRQVGDAADARRGAGHHAPARGPVDDPRRLQGRRRVRPVRVAAARGRDHRQPGRRRGPHRAGAREHRRRGGAPPAGAARRGQLAVHHALPRAARAAAGPAAAAAPAAGHRRVRRAAHRRPGLRRPAAHHRAHRPVDRDAPAPVQPAHRVGTAARAGDVPVVPDRAADVLRGGEHRRAGHPGRVPPAGRPRLRLPQGRHHRLPAVPRGLRLRTGALGDRAGAGGRRGAAPAARAPRAPRRARRQRHRDRWRRRGRAGAAVRRRVDGGRHRRAAVGPGDAHASGLVAAAAVAPAARPRARDAAPAPVRADGSARRPRQAAAGAVAAGPDARRRPRRDHRRPADRPDHPAVDPGRRGSRSRTRRGRWRSTGWISPAVASPGSRGSRTSAASPRGPAATGCGGCSRSCTACSRCASGCSRTTGSTPSRCCAPSTPPGARPSWPPQTWSCWSTGWGRCGPTSRSSTSRSRTCSRAAAGSGCTSSRR